jgi:hypothetical protein
MNEVKQLPFLEACGICTKTTCETNPWSCELDHERMQCRCLREIDQDLRNDHDEDDMPPDTGFPDADTVMEMRAGGAG